MMAKCRQCGALQFGIFTKLIHQQRDKLRGAEIKEFTCQNITRQISM